MKLKETKDIPSDWKVLNVRKKTTVNIRPCNGVERFSVSWSDSELVSDPALDLIVVQPNGKEYPCKYDIFMETYEKYDSRPGGCISREIWDYAWIKKAVTQIVELPEGATVDIESLEGVISGVSYPDYIAIGPRGELYANSKEFVETNLEIL